MKEGGEEGRKFEVQSDKFEVVEWGCFEFEVRSDKFEGEEQVAGIRRQETEKIQRSKHQIPKEARAKRPGKGNGS